MDLSTYRRMKHIDGFNGIFSSLLEAKDQIDPLMQIIAHQLRFQRLSMNEHKETWIPLAPRRQRDFFDTFSILSTAKVETLKVLKHLRQTEELRNELLDICGTIPTGQTVSGVQRMECAIRQIKVVV